MITAPEILFVSFLPLQASLYGAGLYHAFFKERQTRSDDDIENEIAALNLPPGVARLKAIRDDPSVFEKAKKAAQLKVRRQERSSLDILLAQIGLSSPVKRRHFGIYSALFLALSGICGAFGTLLYGSVGITPLFLGANLGLPLGVVVLGLYLWNARRSARREITLILPAFAQQMIAVLVAGHDVESGLRTLLDLYRRRGITNQLVDALSDVANTARHSGSLLQGLSRRASSLDNEDTRRIFASLARSAEYGTSTVRELQDIARALSSQGTRRPGTLFTILSLGRFSTPSLLAYADLSWTTLQYQVLRAALLVGALGLGLAAKASAVTLIFLLGFAGSLPFLICANRLLARARAFDHEFPFFVGQLVSLLRSGKDTLGSLDTVADYLSENSLIRAEIARLLGRLAEGAHETEALVQFGDDIASPAADQIAMSLALSNLAPGKLYHMLEQAVLLVREEATKR